VPSPSCLTTASGRIEIVLMHGPRVIVDTGVDAAALRRVLDVLERP
jgi:UDP-N-acetylmuramyl tripeptide synthase